MKKKFFCNYYTGKVFFYIVTNLVIAYFTFIISPTTKSTITRVHLYSNIFYYFLHFIAPSTWILFCLTFYVYNAHLFLCYFFYIFESKIVCKINVKVSWIFFFILSKCDWYMYSQNGFHFLMFFFDWIWDKELLCTINFHQICYLLWCMIWEFEKFRSLA